MKRLKLVAAALVAVIGITSGVTAQKSISLEELRRMNKKKAAEKKRNQSMKKPEIIAEGAYSGVSEPFILIARDKETFAAIKDLIDDFDYSNEIDFTKQAVVAAFSGEKTTGGYSVSVRMQDGKCLIEDIAPPHGAIVTEALTQPYTVVAIPAEEEDQISLDLGSVWESGIRSYAVRKGEFEFSGGFIGTTTKFKVKGQVSVMRYDRLATVIFDMHEDAAEPKRFMKDVGSGLITNEKPIISRIEGGNFIDRPHPPLQVSGKITDRKLSLTFTPGKRGYVVSDGYEGRGFIEAELVEQP